jgi:membrane protein YdbS with pleckstrin-like domain
MQTDGGAQAAGVAAPDRTTVRRDVTHPRAAQVDTLAVGQLFLVGVFGGLLGSRPLPTGVPTAIPAALGLAYAFFIPGLRFRFWRFALREEELLIERGILTRVRTVVPLRRIQHLDVSQDIFEREYELGRLIVHTAGTRSSDVVLPGLAIEEAEHLRDTIKHYVLEDTL